MKVMCEAKEVIQVVRIKDRFTHPSPGGWRDVMVNYVVVNDRHRHVCELQITHEKMVVQRKG